MAHFSLANYEYFLPGKLLSAITSNKKLNKSTHKYLLKICLSSHFLNCDILVEILDFGQNSDK